MVFGGVVGYGPEPHACIELLRRYNHICVAGNHDWAAIGKTDTSDFNPDAAQACQWTSKQLTKGDTDYLQRLPDKLVQSDFTIYGSGVQIIYHYCVNYDIFAAQREIMKQELPLFLVYRLNYGR